MTLLLHLDFWLGTFGLFALLNSSALFLCILKGISIPASTLQRILQDARHFIIVLYYMYSIDH